MPMYYSLSNDNISQACSEIELFLDSKKIESKEKTRLLISMEEVLLNYQHSFGESAGFTLDKGGGFGKKKFRISVRGERTDPFAVSDYSTEEDSVMRTMLTRMGQLPRWRYKNGANEVIFTFIKKTRPDWIKLIIAIAAACILGLLVRMSPESARILIHDDIIGPLIDTFLGFLNALAGPMIFLSVIWGINNIGDAATFSEIGKHVGIKYGVYLCLMTLAGALMSIPIFTMAFGSTPGSGDFSSLYHMVLDIIPSNLFTPFAQGNTLQILFIAIILGVAMLLISKNTTSVAELSEQFGFIVDGIMGFVSKLVPVFVFGSLFNIIVSSEFSLLTVGGKFFIAALIGCIMLLILHTAAVWIRAKIPPLSLWRKTASTFIIAITTASSSAAFSDNIQTCTNKLGISKRLTSFGVPFGQILYKPAVSILFLYAALSTAQNAQMEISITWIVTALLISIVLSAAAPPVPGGMSASFAVLYAQLGLETGTLAVILSLTSILDFVVTATNIFSSQCVLTIASKKAS